MSKKTDIIELIRITNLQPKQLDSILPNFVSIAIEQHHKTADVNQITLAAKNKISSDAFIEEFIPLFDESFSEEEVKYLLDFYKSDAMKKFTEKSKNLLTPIYSGFSKVILDLLKGA